MKHALKAHLHIGMRSFKTALAAVLCALIYIPLDENPTFACIGAIFGLGNSYENSKLNGGNRFIGSVIGGLLGMLLFRIYIIFHPEGSNNDLLMAALLFVGVLMLITISRICRWPGAVQAGGVVLCIILYNTPTETFVSYALNRIFDTGIGVLVAIIVNTVLPRDISDRIKQIFKKNNVTNE